MTFSANGSNAAKNTTATFTAVGTYTFQVTITDASQLSTTSQVTVTVSPVLTSLTVSPGTVTVAPNGTQQFSASARDQFGNALASQPAVVWSATGSGSISSSGLFKAAATAGSATVQAAIGSTKGQASVSVAASSVLFSDNFSNGAGNWTVTSGYGDYYLYSYNGSNRLMVYNDGSDISRIVAGQASWTNYSYQATLDIDASSSGSASLLARVQDTTHLYFFGYNVALGEWMIALRNGATTSILATSAPYALKFDQDYTVRADLNGNSLKLYVGGVLEVSTTDSTYASGKIGFSGTDALALLGNVVVTTPVSTTTTSSAHPATNQSIEAIIASLLNSTTQYHSWGSWWIG